jgi:hypothetical protein
VANVKRNLTKKGWFWSIAKPMGSPNQAFSFSHRRIEGSNERSNRCVSVGLIEADN